MEHVSVGDTLHHTSKVSSVQSVECVRQSVRARCPSDDGKGNLQLTASDVNFCFLKSARECFDHCDELAYLFMRVK